MEVELTIKLGQEVQDRITRFKGIAIACTRYLQGCNRILVQPRVGEDGVTIPEPQGFDEPDLEVIGNGVLPEPEPEPEPEQKEKGGPRPFASRRPDVTR